VTTFFQLLVSGLALGSAYALVALGFVVIYRASQVFNFAQGEFLVVGAFSAVSLHAVGVPLLLAVPIAMAITGALGAAIERVVLRPLIGRPVFVTIIVTIFIGAILRSLALIVWGTDPRGMPTPWETTGDITLAGVSIPLNAIGTMALCAAALFAFYLVIAYSRVGVAMRATASDQETALAMGMPVGRVFGTTWFISGAYAALAGMCLGLFPRAVEVNLGFVALRAFPAVIVGGLDSIWGTVLAGLLLGVLEVLAQGYVNPYLGEFGHNFHAVFPYVVMIAFLVVRPYGLFGTAEVERV